MPPPITFKVDGTLAGNTGAVDKSNVVSFGYGALSSNTTGDNNTAIGWMALNGNTIGYNARATSSDQVRIGNIEVTSIGGYVAWTNLSDKRTKKNIRPDVPGLAFNANDFNGTGGER